MLRSLAILGVLSLALLLPTNTIWAEDIAAAKDHPVVDRFPGSEIKWHDVQAFEPYAIATGPVTGYRAIGYRCTMAATKSRLTASAY